MKKKIYKDVKKFTIKRSEWTRGNKNGPSRLLNEDGFKCCLGFYALASGLRNQDIKLLYSPTEIILDKNKRWDSFLLKESLLDDKLLNSDACETLMFINDNPVSSDKVKEKDIIKMFKQHNVQVRFID